MSKQKSFEESLDELVEEKLEDNKYFIEHIKGEEENILGSMDGFSSREKQHRKKDSEFLNSRDNLYNDILSRKSLGLENVIEQKFKAFDRLEDKFQEEAQITAIDKAREASLKNLTEGFKGIFEQYDENQAKKIRKNVEKKLYGTDDPEKIANKKIEARQAEVAKATAAAQEKKQLEKKLAEQTKVNDEFITEIESKFAALDSDNPDSSKEKKQQLYQDSLLDNERNLKDLMIDNMKFFTELTNQYPNHRSLIERRENLVIDSLGKKFAEIFPDQHDEKQQKRLKQQAAESNLQYNTKNTVTTTTQTIITHKWTDNQELDQTISEVVVRQANRQELLKDAKNIENGLWDAVTMNARDFGRNFAKGQKRLQAEIINVKLDIYLLADLKSKTTKKDDHQLIDGLINQLTKNYEQAVPEVRADSKPEENLGRYVTDLKRGGTSYSLIMNNSPERIARIIEQSPEYQNEKKLVDIAFNVLTQGQVNGNSELYKKSEERAERFNVDNFLIEARPEVVLKIQAIQNILDERA